MTRYMHLVDMSFVLCFFFFKQKTAYEMRISDWSSDVCSSDLLVHIGILPQIEGGQVKTEGIDRADDSSERTVGRQNSFAAVAQRPRDHREVMAELVRRQRRVRRLPIGRAHV